MSAERHLRIKEIFADALELQPAERVVYLDSVCGDDPELRQDIQQLLLHSDHAGELPATSDVLGSSFVSEFLFSDEETSTLQPNDVLGRRFRISRLIGSGGMGEVYEAEDNELGVRVAIKTLRPRLMQSPEFRARFRREIRLSRKVSHPNVCRIFDYQHERVRGIDVVFLSMELLNGCTLGERLRAGPMSPHSVASIARQIATGLSALHKENVIHRDLKPGNVVLVAEDHGERAVITDFGLAHSLVPAGTTEHSEVTVAGQILGTPAYMSPEQLTGQDVGPSSDIYALGIVMYESLCGRRPFPADNIFESAAQKLADNPEPPSLYAPISSEWDSFILRCLERDPKRRVQTAVEFLSLLDGVVSCPLTPVAGARRRIGNAVAGIRHHWLPAPTWGLGGLLRRHPFFYSGLAAVGVAVTLPLSDVRPAAVRRLCEQFPGSSLMCELPSDKDIAVFPFAVKAVNSTDEPLGQGIVQHLRESFERLAPEPEQMCVHLRPDKQSAGVDLVLEGNVLVDRESVAVEMVVRESNAPAGKQAPLVLRRSTVHLSRASSRELYIEPLRQLANLLEVSYPEREWQSWSKAVPGGVQSTIAHLRGLGLLYSGKYEEAANEFRSVIDPATDFAFAPAHVGLGDAYRLLRNRSGDRAWELRARQAYQRAVPLDRDFGFAGAEKKWGELEAGAGNPAAAVEHLNAALSFWPHDQAMLKVLAAAYEAGEQKDAAMGVLRDAVTRAPNCWLTHNTLADFYSRHGRFSDAERELLEVVRLAPDNSAAYGNLAFIYVKTGRFDDAIEMSSRAIAIRPHPIYYSTLGRAFLYRGCTSDALVNLVKATETGPEFWETWTNLSEGLHAMEPRSAAATASYKRAIETAAKFLERRPSDAHVRGQYALNLARAGRSTEAVEQAMRALGHGRPSHDVLLTAVQALELSGVRDKAIQILGDGFRTGLSVHEAEASFGLANLRRDLRYRNVLRRTGLDPASDPGGLVARPSRSCPEWGVPGKGHKNT